MTQSANCCCLQILPPETASSKLFTALQSLQQECSRDSHAVKLEKLSKIEKSFNFLAWMNKERSVLK